MAASALTRVGGPTVGGGALIAICPWIPIGTPGTGTRIIVGCFITIIILDRVNSLCYMSQTLPPMTGSSPMAQFAFLNKPVLIVLYGVLCKITVYIYVDLDHPRFV
jgi:hypothetical protein